jgi:uncharacterized Zn finger protein
VTTRARPRNIVEEKYRPDNQSNDLSTRLVPRYPRDAFDIEILETCSVRAKSTHGAPLHFRCCARNCRH